jgi:Flp pilus assembly protein TadG
MYMKRIYGTEERGQSLLEMALVLPVLLIILAGLLDIGRLYYAYVAIKDAAGEGATFAAIHPEESYRTELYNRIQSASGGLVQIDPALVKVDCPVIATGATVTVTVGYSFTVATPLVNAIVPDGVIPLRAVASEVILAGEMTP